MTRRALLGVAGFALATGAGPALAQPEPSFRATCAELRTAIRRLDLIRDPLVTIQVVGPVRMVHSDGVLAYIAVCAPPDPEVLCVTYDTNGRKPGDAVVVSGAYGERGPNHIQLDPCLHFLPGAK